MTRPRRPHAREQVSSRGQVAGTTLGSQVWDATQARLRRGEDHVLAALDPAERETLRALLQRLAVDAQTHHPVHDACQLVEDLA